MFEILAHLPYSESAIQHKFMNYLCQNISPDISGIVAKISNTFLFLFSNKMLVSA